MSTETLIMTGKMAALTLTSVLLTYLMWRFLKDRPMTNGIRIAVGIIFGMFSVMSTHFGVDYGSMLLNVRDLGPMSAGLFFDPVSGIIAGLIGGIERYIAGTYWDIAPFTRVACSVSTCLAGFLAAFLRTVMLRGRKPSPAFAFFMGAVIEVFHMYVVFVTHREEMDMAVTVVKVCSAPMILFSGLGLALTALVLRVSEGINPFRKLTGPEITVSDRFRTWLFAVTTAVLLINFMFNFSLQTQAAEQSAKKEIEFAEADIVYTYEMFNRIGGNPSRMVTHIGDDGIFAIFGKDGEFIAGYDDSEEQPKMLAAIEGREDGEYFKTELFYDRWLCKVRYLVDGSALMIMIPEGNTNGGMYQARDIQALETLLGDILIFTVIYALISILVQLLVVNNLYRVNGSLNKITDGDLDEKVNVYDSMEFASLSDDINSTVDALKGYIDEAGKRMEKELHLAARIQDSALPKQFDFNNRAFDVFATMDPARQVGGDFYDFFFVDIDKIALVIADVSDKGIPASLFMMHSKTALRGFAETGSSLTEVFEKVNAELCKGNEAEMFVTVWMGIVDLGTGKVTCINAGHEYPVIIHRFGLAEMFKEKHCPPLGVIEDLTFREYEIELEPGDCLFVYTDGVPDAMNKQEEQFGTDRLISVLNMNKDCPMVELLPAVQRELDEFVGAADQFDDVTMLGFRYNGRED